MTQPLTPEQFLAKLQDADKTVADWCRENACSSAVAYRVLKGDSIGRWGEARRVAKKMGLRLPETPAAIARLKVAA